MLEVVKLNSRSNVMLGAWPPRRWQVPVFRKSCWNAVKELMPHGEVVEPNSQERGQERSGDRHQTQPRSPSGSW